MSIQIFITGGTLSWKLTLADKRLGALSLPLKIEKPKSLSPIVV